MAEAVYFCPLVNVSDRQVVVQRNWLKIFNAIGRYSAVIEMDGNDIPVRKSVDEQRQFWYKKAVEWADWQLKVTLSTDNKVLAIWLVNEDETNVGLQPWVKCV